MKNKLTKRILFAVFAVALCVAAYFAADIPFFQFNDYEYQDKGAALFSSEWFYAMLPFGIIILVSVVCIALDVWLRKLLYKKKKCRSERQTSSQSISARSGLYSALRVYDGSS